MPNGRRIAGMIVAAGVLVVVTACTGSSEDPPDDPCGEAVAKAGGGRWVCTFSDDFRGDQLDPAKWVVQRTALSGFRTGPECYGSTDNVTVGGGVLRLTARKVVAPFTCHDPSGDFVTRYTGGMVSTWKHFSQTYGRFEIRARMPDAKVRGLHSAMWLWPQDVSKRGGKPSSGEIDIGEFYSAYPDRVVPYVHYAPAGTDRNVTNNYCYVTDPSAWHTYVLEWTTKTLTISYDGKKCLVNTWNPAPPWIKPAPFDQPFIIALTQALGVATTANEFSAESTPLPATMQVDHVRVWK